MSMREPYIPFLVVPDNGVGFHAYSQVKCDNSVLLLNLLGGRFSIPHTLLNSFALCVRARNALHGNTRWISNSLELHHF